MLADAAAFNPVVFEIVGTGLFVLGLLVYPVACACWRWVSARVARRQREGRRVR